MTLTVHNLAGGLAGVTLPVDLAPSATGQRVDYAGISAPGLPDQRLSLWLPPGYDPAARAYPVLYMQDGHNLFERETSVFGKIWRADHAMLAAMATGRVAPHIIVGIWAPGEDRWRQYLPHALYLAAEPLLRRLLDARAGGPVVSHLYLDWLTGPLKSAIDRSFRTLPGPATTAIAGSSMGGLISLHAFVTRPDIFRCAACLSTHWPALLPPLTGTVADNIATLWQSWLAADLGAPQGRRLWLDHGDQELDAFYAPYQTRIDRTLADLGWNQQTGLESHVFPGTTHDENAWAARLSRVFSTLLHL